MCLLFISCKKSTADVPDPIKQLVTHLKATNPDCTCEPYLDKFKWKSEVVYVLAYKGPVCSWVPTYYRSNGQPFTLPEGYSYQAFFKESTFVRNVWTCGN